MIETAQRPPRTNQGGRSGDAVVGCDVYRENIADAHITTCRRCRPMTSEWNVGCNLLGQRQHAAILVALLHGLRFEAPPHRCVLNPLSGRRDEREALSARASAANRECRIASKHGGWLFDGAGDHAGCRERHTPAASAGRISKADTPLVTKFALHLCSNVGGQGQRCSLQRAGCGRTPLHQHQNICWLWPCALAVAVR